VREWLPGGATIPGVKLSIETDKLYPPRKPQTVTIIRLRDGNVRRQTLTAGADGRLNLDLDGDEYEVGISSGPVLALSGYQLDGAAWATAGEPCTRACASGTRARRPRGRPRCGGSAPTRAWIWRPCRRNCRPSRRANPRILR
jgi:hypothetical protein